MIVAVFSDVHGNLPALEAFVAATRGVADAYLCLGDVVNYGPWNDECLELVHSLPGIRLLEGNHERLFTGADPVEREPALVREFYQHSRSHFSRLDLIAELPQQLELGGFLCTHTLGDARIYPDTQIEVERDCMVGHSHHQFSIPRSGHTIVNPGSVGQNRRHIRRLSYALYDTETAAVTLREEPSPIERLLDEMRARGYSQRCLAYYLDKLGWEEAQR